MLSIDEERYLRQKALMNALEFTSADLQVNQSGILTDDQRERLYELSLYFRKRAFGYTFAIISIIGGTLFASTLRISIPFSEVAMYLFAGGIIFLGWYAYSSFWKWRWYIVAGQSHVETVRGPLRRMKSSDSGAEYFEVAPLKIKDKRFLSVSPLDDFYTVHYEPKSGKILSAEWHGQVELT